MHANQALTESRRNEIFVQGDGPTYLELSHMQTQHICIHIGMQIRLWEIDVYVIYKDKSV